MTMKLWIYEKQTLLWEDGIIISFYFDVFPVSYQQCIKDLLYVSRGPSNYYHQPVLVTSLWRLVENFSHHLPSLRPATVYIFL